MLSDQPAAAVQVFPKRALTAAVGVIFGEGQRRTMKAAAVLAWVLADRGYVWTFMGFPTYEAGPLFADVGLETTTVPLLVAFLLVCVAEVVVGVMLWQRRRTGALVAFGLLPAEFIFWIGFVLPFGPVFGLARTGLVATGWPPRASSRR